MINEQSKLDDLKTTGVKALERLMNHVEGCDVEVSQVVREGAGRTIAAITTNLDPVLAFPATSLMADIIKMTYKAGYLHGKSHQIRETN